MSVVARALPSAVSEGVNKDTRSDLYGNMGVIDYAVNPKAMADEGSYFVGVNAASGTAITASIATAYSATASGFIALRNTAASGSTKRVYVDFIKLICAVAPVNATDWKAVVDIDTVLTRFTSGGTAITPKNANVGSSTAASALLNAGALTTVAISSAGISLGQTDLRRAIPVIGDEYLFVFGSPSNTSASIALNGTAPTKYVINYPPAVLPAQAALVLSLFGTAHDTTASQYFVQVGWSER